LNELNGTLYRNFRPLNIQPDRFGIRGLTKSAQQVRAIVTALMSAVTALPFIMVVFVPALTAFPAVGHLDGRTLLKFELDYAGRMVVTHVFTSIFGCRPHI